MDAMAIPAMISNPVLIFFIVLVIILIAPILLNMIRVPHIVGLIVAGDLDHNRDAISDMIADVVMRRFYYEPGRVEYTLNSDKCLNEVEKTMSTPGEYRRILALDGDTRSTEKKKK